MSVRVNYWELNSHLPDVKAANTIRAAISTVSRAAWRTPPHIDAMTPLFMGGTFSASDLDHIGALLELVNRPAIESIGDFEFPKTSDVIDARLLRAAQRAALIATLADIVADNGVARRREIWKQKVRGKVLRAPSFGSDPDRAVVTDKMTARRYVLLLLTEPKHLQLLRRCQLESCRRFFLDVDATTRPGERLKYCKDRDCGKLSDKIAARLRAENWRKSKRLERTRKKS